MSVRFPLGQRRFTVLALTFWVVLLVAAGWSVAKGAGVAQASSCLPPIQAQAGYYHGGGNDDGTRAWISGTAANNSCGAVEYWVAVQNQPPTANPTKWIQTGELKDDYGFGASDCDNGTDGVVALVEEWGSSLSNYKCDVIPSTVTRDTFGNGNEFACALGVNGWGCFFNSNKEESEVSLGFSGGYTVARAEAFWGNAHPSWDLTWGGSSGTPWQYKLDSGSYEDIRSGAIRYQFSSPSGNANWNINSGEPPFGVTW